MTATLPLMVPPSSAVLPEAARAVLAAAAVASVVSVLRAPHRLQCTWNLVFSRAKRSLRRSTRRKRELRQVHAASSCSIDHCSSAALLAERQYRPFILLPLALVLVPQLVLHRHQNALQAAARLMRFATPCCRVLPEWQLALCPRATRFGQVWP